MTTTPTGEATPRHLVTPPGLELRESGVGDGTQGVFCLTPIAEGQMYGPYAGEVILEGHDSKVDYRYAWEVYNTKNNELMHIINATKPETGNWMRYVNCARYFEEQNIVSVQVGSEIFYKAIRAIPAEEELMTWFSLSYQMQKSKKKRKSVNTPDTKDGAKDTAKESKDSSKGGKETVAQSKKKKKMSTSDSGTPVDDMKTPILYEMMTTDSKYGKAKNSPIEEKKKTKLTKSKSTGSIDVTSLKGAPKQQGTPTKKPQTANNTPIKNLVNTSSGTKKSTPKKALKVKDLLALQAAKSGAKTELPVPNKLPIPKLKPASTDNPKVKSQTKVKVEGQGESVMAGMVLHSEHEASKIYQFELRQEHHVEDKNGKKTYTCDICFAPYSHAFSLKRHFLRSHVNAKYLPLSDITNCLINVTQQESAVKTCPNNAGRFSKEDGKMINKEKGETNGEVDGQESVRLVGVFRCYLCSELFDSLEDMKVHTKDHPVREKITKKFSCDKCDMKFSQKNNLARHQEAHAEAKKSSCPVCDKSFNKESNMKKHLQFHLNKNFTCTACGEKFTTVAELRKHLRMEHPASELKMVARENLKSSNSEQTTDSAKVLKPSPLKKKVKMKKKLLQAKPGGGLKKTEVTLKPAPNSSLSTEADSKPVPCPICNKRFSSVPSMKKHAQFHGNRRFSCRYCKEKFPHPFGLRKHLWSLHFAQMKQNLNRTTGVTRKIPTFKQTPEGAKVKQEVATPGKITPEAPAESKPVNMLIGSSSNVKTSADKPFSCRVCGKAFPSEANMKMHLQYHFGRTFSCRFCFKKFPHPASLRKHLNLEHPEGMVNGVLIKNKPDIIIGPDGKRLRRKRKKKRPEAEQTPPTEETVKKEVVEVKEEKIESVENKNETRTEVKYVEEVQDLEEEEEEDLWEEEIRITKELKQKTRLHFSCILCKKRFNTYVNMCRHKRLAHRVKKYGMPTLTRQRIAAKMQDCVVVNDYLPITPAEFYANVAENIATNLDQFIDGKQEALNHYEKHVRIPDYQSVFNVSLEEKETIEWSKYNFPRSFTPWDGISSYEIGEDLNGYDQIGFRDERAARRRLRRSRSSSDGSFDKGILDDSSNQDMKSPVKSECRLLLEDSDRRITRSRSRSASFDQDESSNQGLSRTPVKARSRSEELMIRRRRSRSTSLDKDQTCKDMMKPSKTEIETEESLYSTVIVKNGSSDANIVNATKKLFTETYCDIDILVEEAAKKEGDMCKDLGQNTKSCAHCEKDKCADPEGLDSKSSEGDNNSVIRVESDNDKPDSTSNLDSHDDTTGPLCDKLCANSDCDIRECLKYIVDQCELQVSDSENKPETDKVVTEKSYDDLGMNKTIKCQGLVKLDENINQSGNQETKIETLNQPQEDGQNSEEFQGVKVDENINRASEETKIETLNQPQENSQNSEEFQGVKLDKNINQASQETKIETPNQSNQNGQKPEELNEDMCDNDQDTKNAQIVELSQICEHVESQSPTEHGDAAKSTEKSPVVEPITTDPVSVDSVSENPCDKHKETKFDINLLEDPNERNLNENNSESDSKIDVDNPKDETEGDKRVDSDASQVDKVNVIPAPSIKDDEEQEVQTDANGCDLPRTTPCSCSSDLMNGQVPCKGLLPDSDLPESVEVDDAQAKLNTENPISEKIEDGKACPSIVEVDNPDHTDDCNIPSSKKVTWDSAMCVRVKSPEKLSSESETDTPCDSDIGIWVKDVLLSEVVDNVLDKCAVTYEKPASSSFEQAKLVEKEQFFSHLGVTHAVISEKEGNIDNDIKKVVESILSEVASNNITSDMKQMLEGNNNVCIPKDESFQTSEDSPEVIVSQILSDIVNTVCSQTPEQIASDILSDIINTVCSAEEGTVLSPLNCEASQPYLFGTFDHGLKSPSCILKHLKLKRWNEEALKELCVNISNEDTKEEEVPPQGPVIRCKPLMQLSPVPSNNFKTIAFGSNGQVNFVCGVCKKHFLEMDGLLRHHLKKHPSIDFSFIEVESGNDIDLLFYSWPCNYGLLASSQPFPEDCRSLDVFTCTRCGSTFKHIHRLHVHIINCDPKNYETLAAKRRKYRKKMRKQMMEAIKAKRSEEQQGKTAATPPRKPGRPKGVFGTRKKKEASDSPMKNRKRRNYELLYNPHNHVRRREMTDVLETHQCRGCENTFKTLSLLERHAKKCAGREKLQKMKSVQNTLFEEITQKPRHTCRYCSKHFTYLKSLANHYLAFCSVRKSRLQKGLLGAEDFKDEEDLHKLIKRLELSKLESKEAEMEETDGRRKKGGWPRGVKRKNRRKRHCWTYVKKKKPDEKDGSEGVMFDPMLWNPEVDWMEQLLLPGQGEEEEDSDEDEEDDDEQEGPKEKENPEKESSKKEKESPKKEKESPKKEKETSKKEKESPKKEKESPKNAVESPTREKEAAKKDNKASPKKDIPKKEKKFEKKDADKIKKDAAKEEKVVNEDGPDVAFSKKETKKKETVKKKVPQTKSETITTEVKELPKKKNKEGKTSQKKKNKKILAKSEPKTPLKTDEIPSKASATPKKASSTPLKANSSPSKSNSSPAKLNSSPTEAIATPSKANSTTSKENSTPSVSNSKANSTKSKTNPTQSTPSKTNSITLKSKATPTKANSAPATPSKASPAKINSTPSKANASPSKQTKKTKTPTESSIELVTTEKGTLCLAESEGVCSLSLSDGSETPGSSPEKKKRKYVRKVPLEEVLMKKKQNRLLKLQQAMETKAAEMEEESSVLTPVESKPKAKKKSSPEAGTSKNSPPAEIEKKASVIDIVKPALAVKTANFDQTTKHKSLLDSGTVTLITVFPTSNKLVVPGVIQAPTVPVKTTSPKKKSVLMPKEETVSPKKVTKKKQTDIEKSDVTESTNKTVPKSPKKKQKTEKTQGDEEKPKKNQTPKKKAVSNASDIVAGNSHDTDMKPSTPKKKKTEASATSKSEASPKSVKKTPVKAKAEPKKTCGTPRPKKSPNAKQSPAKKDESVSSSLLCFEKLSDTTSSPESCKTSPGSKASAKKRKKVEAMSSLICTEEPDFLYDSDEGTDVVPKKKVRPQLKCVVPTVVESQSQEFGQESDISR